MPANPSNLQRSGLKGLLARCLRALLGPAAGAGRLVLDSEAALVQTPRELSRVQGVEILSPRGGVTLRVIDGGRAAEPRQSPVGPPRSSGAGTARKQSGKSVC